MAQPFAVHHLPVFKEITLSAKPFNIITCPCGGFLVQYSNSAVVSRFDANYNLQWEHPIGDAVHAFNLTISADGAMIGVSGREFVRVYDGQGKLLFTHPHYRWESYESSDCYFHMEQGRVSHFMFFEPLNNGDGLFQCFDASTFQLLQSVLWTEMDNHFIFYPTPACDKFLINLLAGQDGSQLLLATIADGKINLQSQEKLICHAIGNFSPDGYEMVATEYDDMYLATYSFPGMQQQAIAHGEDVFEENDQYPGMEEDNVEYQSWFLSNKTILTKTRYGRLLLFNRHSLQLTGELLPDQCQYIAYNEAGKPTSQPAEILDYASEAGQVFLTSTGDLVVIHTRGTIMIYKVPAV